MGHNIKLYCAIEMKGGNIIHRSQYRAIFCNMESQNAVFMLQDAIEDYIAQYEL